MGASPRPGTAPSLQPVELITQLPLLYRVFFLYLEPVSALVGAYFAACRPHAYLALTHSASAPAPAAVPTGTAVVLAQLANLYVLFTLNEAFVLRSSRDVRVWRALLSVLLAADLGHLCSVAPLGLHQYYAAWRWNAMDAGNLGFVYLGAIMRVAFLAGVGVRTSRTALVAGPKKIKM
ncbi:uncharacterized protein PV09_07432 [Verruconis gallopava]|uniref:DUF7704 domain-containing protein n=1 Tax=Verruconis gallopava TaxID=253628 RepID=A0A0D1XG23_9PEZI|nr:uncharacterized protein PV09_07432 [Verruconis gallopava]KIW01146.1 hypothetical protein PV09_07432 [Verruconis gallopava]